MGVIYSIRTVVSRADIYWVVLIVSFSWKYTAGSQISLQSTDSHGHVNAG
jgi:hypothetical protein